MLKLCVLLVFLTILNSQNIFCTNTKGKGSLNIFLNRQKTGFEQHLNYGKILKRNGIDMDWLYKRIKPAPKTNDSVALYRFLDHEFYGEIVIGHPGQKFYVAFDTAWSLTWILSSECHVYKNFGCLFHSKYDHTRSSEYKPDGRPSVVPEGKYNLSGYFSYDNISISHTNVTNFLFAEMTSVPYTMLFNKIDGVIGLGLQNDQYQPFFYSWLKHNPNITSPIFCVYLNRDKQSKNGGNIIMGELEKRHIHKIKLPNETIVYDDILYMPVKPGYAWTFDLEKVYLNVSKNEQVLTFCTDASSGCTAITDTSSNNIYGPKDAIDKIHKIMKASPFFLNRYTVNCDTINKLPVIGFTIGGQNFNLKGVDYTIKMSYMSVTFCISAFLSHDIKNYWVLGGAFLSEYYTIYNVQEKKIGFVKAA
ncbi:hypothetical protein ABEB36_002899 [Hypothenemus hampei]|uniref:Peptidase A1 domain-containing protein n=1 Tax=Hypothenemus hampei TaxID=57062 RepID=A0ABD1F7C9_HYPHA